jgi:hypothetical protein
VDADGDDMRDQRNPQDPTHPPHSIDLTRLLAALEERVRVMAKDAVQLTGTGGVQITVGWDDDSVLGGLLSLLNEPEVIEQAQDRHGFHAALDWYDITSLRQVRGAVQAAYVRGAVEGIRAVAGAQERSGAPASTDTLRDDVLTAVALPTVFAEWFPGQDWQENLYAPAQRSLACSVAESSGRHADRPVDLVAGERGEASLWRIGRGGMWRLLRRGLRLVAGSVTRSQRGRGAPCACTRRG